MRVGAFAALAAGCSLGLRGSGGPVPHVERSGVVYWAETIFLTDDPVRIQTIVGATNRRNRPVEVQVVSCPVFVRLYGAPARTGLPAWDEEPAYARWKGESGRRDDRRGSDCERGGKSVVIAPGKSTWLTVSVVEPAGMGDTIPPGRYYFTAVVPVGGRRLELISGESALGVTTGEIERRSGEGREPRANERG